MPAPLPVLDPAAPWPELARHRAAPDWDVIASFIDGIPDPQDRWYAALALADSAPAGALHAVDLIRQGWQGRGTGPAVAPARLDEFLDHVRRAERILIDATAVSPSDPVAWTARLLTARALGFDACEARRRFLPVAGLYPAQRYLMQHLCPSWEDAYEFARESSHGVLLVEYHLEKWLWTGRDPGYFRQPPVLVEVRAAAEQTAAFAASYYHYEVHNLLAAAFCLAARYDEARPHFAVIGAYATELPWSLFGGGAAVAFVYQRSLC